ncbi:MAG TPA: M20/M25/M40 family metallo-hydrolase, partial [Acidimicrobiales bacterium]
ALAVALLAAGCTPAVERFDEVEGPLADAVIFPAEMDVDLSAVPVDIPAVIAGVQQTELRAHIEALGGPRPGSSANALAAADHIEAHLDGLGLTVHRQPASTGSVTMPNVYADRPGTVCPDRVFVVGAHYDTVPGSPGADDNASGTAGMLEAARVLRGTPLPVTVRFAGFALEEDGLVGSGVMAADLAASGTDVVGMVSLEMIGFTRIAPDPFIGTTQDFLAMIGEPTRSARLAEVFGAASLAHLPYHFAPAAVLDPTTFTPILRSDHARFWQQGYPALLITDTADFRNPNYHRSTDTLDTLNMGFMAASVQSVLSGLIAFTTIDADGDGTPDVCA